MKNRRKFVSLLMLAAALAFGIFASSVPAQADTFLDFNMDAIHPAGASISYAGGATPLVGTNISVDSVTGINTPLNSGLSVPFIGYLSFTTGNFTGNSPDEWFFGPGGNITMIGSIDGGITFYNVLTGTWTEAEVDKNSGNFKVTIGAFVDFKNQDLEALYGFPTGLPWNGNINLSFLAVGDSPNAFTSSSIGSGDIFNTPVPEPGTMMLLGSGLVGLAGWGRKKFRK